MQEYCLPLKILFCFFSISYQINKLKYESLMSKFAHKVSINTQKKTAAKTGKNGGFFGKYLIPHYERFHRRHNLAL